MDDWPDTPEEERIRARLLDGRMVDYKQLCVGDVFQAIATDGEAIHPYTEEPDAETFAYCDGEPEPDVANGQGYGVPLQVGPLDVLRKKHMS